MKKTTPQIPALMNGVKMSSVGAILKIIVKHSLKLSTQIILLVFKNYTSILKKVKLAEDPCSALKIMRT